ncbi:MAG: DNA alkylation repair protein [Chitinivibrionales bacterium]|nr:DNA alkylation repair protein [Chitinivibrionales bacterium]
MQEYEPGDFSRFKLWVDSYVSNWASCDTLCNHTIGAFVERYPDHVPELKKWATSSNHWMRRAAAVTTIIPAKKGMFLPEILAIATILLQDANDLVQKGYGWMLKEASRIHQKEVFDFIMKNKKTMPRTALRYTIEKMPKELKAAAMA